MRGTIVINKNVLSWIALTFLSLVISVPLKAQKPLLFPDVPGPDLSGAIRLGNEAPTQPEDEQDSNYVKGRALFLGQNREDSVKFCVLANKTDALLEPLNRKTIKQLRRLPVKEFVKRLYDCDNPKVYALSYFEAEEAGMIVYYLNSKYRLRLEQ